MKTFITNPNQKMIVIKKEECNKDNKYTTINIEALRLAMRNLTNAEFKAGVYLAKNANNYELALSPAEAQLGGIKKSTMQVAVRHFEDLGYLEQIDNKNNEYIFHERPLQFNK